MVVINFVFISSLLLGFAGQFFSPSYYSIFAIFSLIYPYSVFAVFITGILLLALGSKYTWAAVVVLVMTSGTTVRQMGFHFSPNLPEDKELFSITSFNVKNNFYHLKKNQFKDFIDDYQKEKPDIFLFQEISKGKLNEVKKSLNYNYSSSDFKDNEYSLGILSKYAIEKVAVLQNQEGNPMAMIMDVKFPNKSIRVINLHLHSNGVTLRAERFSAESISNAKGLKKLIAMIKSYGDNSELRIKEIENIHSYIVDSPHPVIVAGDANDTPYSVVYKRLSTMVDDSFVKRGLGFAQTYNGLLVPLKIDHIFVDSNFCIYNTNIKKVHYSDHNPISTTFEFCAQ